MHRDVAGAEVEVSARSAVGESVAFLWMVNESKSPAWSCVVYNFIKPCLAKSQHVRCVHARIEHV